ncbi:MAG TPA: hypothetical protein VLJ88_03050 [Propionibacteriaceae bacterium]|nr:hypothetical protein [Propionibacteriaceae bacterium]
MSMRKIRLSLILLAVILAAPLFWSGPPARAAADGCEPGFSTDFNGDGFSDTVVADPYATVGTVAEAGRVIVLYGDDDGRIGEGDRAELFQGAIGVGNAAEAGDRFGFALAVADINCDEFADLMVGSPYENVGAEADAGLVQIVWGGGGGLGSADPSEQIDIEEWGEESEAGNHFGYAVDALEDVGQGATSEPFAHAIAIGAPGFDVGSANDAGWVGMTAAADGGSSSSAVTQNSPGIPGAAETGDRFGAALSINQLIGENGTVDVAVGVPNEDIGSLADAGSVIILQDLYDPVETGIAIDQNSAGVPGVVEAGDRFGRSLDSIKVISNSTSWLAIGVPGEDVGSRRNAGSVQLFRSNQITLSPRAGLSQDTAGVGDAAQSGDLFGDRLAFGLLGRAESSIRLAVSAPDEDGAATNTGLVQVFPVTNLDAEVSYAQNSPGVPGAATAGDRFGAALAVVVGAPERAVIVGVPDDVDNASGMVNVIPFGGGAPRYWAPGINGVPGPGSSRFGAALGSVHGST